MRRPPLPCPCILLVLSAWAGGEGGARFLLLVLLRVFSLCAAACMHLYVHYPVCTLSLCCASDRPVAARCRPPLAGATRLGAAAAPRTARRLALVACHTAPAGTPAPGRSTASPAPPRFRLARPSCHPSAPTPPANLPTAPPGRRVAMNRGDPPPLRLHVRRARLCRFANATAAAVDPAASIRGAVVAVAAASCVVGADSAKRAASRGRRLERDTHSKNRQTSDAPYKTRPYGSKTHAPARLGPDCATRGPGAQPRASTAVRRVAPRTTHAGPTTGHRGMAAAVRLSHPLPHLQDPVIRYGRSTTGREGWERHRIGRREAPSEGVAYGKHRDRNGGTRVAIGDGRG